MKNYILIFFGSIIIFNFIIWLFSLVSGWQKLSKKYRTVKNPPSTFIKDRRAFFNGSPGTASTGKLGVGVSEEGLYLSNSLATTLPPLLIPWNDIYYEKTSNANTIAKSFILNLGNPKITSLELYFETIEKIHEDYGEPIFFERLGVSN